MATRTRTTTTTSPVYNVTQGRFITISEIKELVNDCLNYMQEHQLYPNFYSMIEFNTCLKKACGRTARRDGIYRLEFSSNFFRVADEEHIKETILHECIHLVPGCWDHKKKFKSIALILNAHYGVDISRTISDPQYMAQRKEEKENAAKYRLKCPKCKKTWLRKNGGKWVGRYQVGTTWFTCPDDKIRLIAEKRIAKDKFEPIPVKF